MRRSLYNSYAEIHLDHIESNLQILKAESGHPSQTMAVIKADAYGHGSVKVADYLKNKVDWFGVATVREGIALREAGISTPILVLGVPDVTNRNAYKTHNLTAVISELNHFQLLPDDTTYHINFDTGMGRLGLYPFELNEVLNQVKQQDQLQLGGIMSHFSTADRPGSGKVKTQIDLFNEIQAAFPHHIIRHLANTGGAVFYNKVEYDMVRFGIGLYGYPPGSVPIPGLEPVLVWKSHLAQVKSIKKGMTVSYLDQWTAPRDGYVGVIPVGYGDGYPRNIGGKVHVLVDGKLYPQVGIVTMDYIMVYLDRDIVPVNTEVVLMGVPGITATDLADAMDTINYELLCRVSERVERIYINP